MIVYSTNCSRCKVLLKKLQMKGVEFELVEDEEEVMRVAAEYGIQEVPFVIDNGELLTFSEVIKRI